MTKITDFGVLGLAVRFPPIATLPGNRPQPAKIIGLPTKSIGAPIKIIGAPT